ncbi:DUF4932 domain-containing protein [Dyadobacter sp. LJ53]|uniref:DUF4932 domain-containing protein n=1 Tax=Dyadobacter chenwenxiniae TaxID=2906456 RepID=UPI001F47B23A|nr:DUF4932 domain-containing protein [Dyadobacter chenwenxiniae]MCF0048525.1 DUF4932 domain-containing protein [Dyadobacter chenwenxiniae]
MKASIQLIFLIFISISPALCQTNPIGQKLPTHRQFQIQINKNVELLGFVYFLGYEGAQAETEGYSANRNARYAYGLDLYRQFKDYEKSRHLAIIIGFAQDIWLDKLINLLVQLDEFPNATLRGEIDAGYYLAFSPKKDPVEARKNATAFIDAMNQLWREVDFDKYLQKNRPKYENALAQVRSGMPDSLFIPTMEKFYQAHLASYILAPSLTIPPGMGFGINYCEQEQKHAFHVFGAFGIPAFKDSSNLDMGFNDQKHLLELSTHEFGHSFVNPAIDQLPGEMITKTEKLFEPIKATMANQGYTAWKACIYEHFVRAGEIIISQSRGNIADTQRLRKHYEEERKFIYLPLILKELTRYKESKSVSYNQAVRAAMHALVRKAVEK